MESKVFLELLLRTSLAISMSLLVCHLQPRSATQCHMIKDTVVAITNGTTYSLTHLSRTETTKTVTTYSAHQECK